MTDDVRIKKYNNIFNERYKFLKNETEEMGVKVSSNNKLYHNIDNRCFLKEEAFYPTGLALSLKDGDLLFAEEIFNVIKELEEKIKEIINSKQQIFAYVPFEMYHATILNYSHFEVNEVRYIDRTTFREIEKYFEMKKLEEIKVEFEGIIITSNGRIIIPGYLLDEKINVIREDLRSMIPEFNNFKPNTFHIKVCHVLCDINRDKMIPCLNSIKEYGLKLKARIGFSTIFTKNGVIDLRGNK